VPAAELDAAVEEVVARFASGPTVALGLTKWLLHEGASSPFDAQLEYEAFALELSSRSADFREGMNAFREKRAPRFDGR
jgi:2-(1,2-epoxy-1,2-dihydrophenyl)acetyl-CoA isomerase